MGERERERVKNKKGRDLRGGKRKTNMWDASTISTMRVEFEPLDLEMDGGRSIEALGLSLYPGKCECSCIFFWHLKILNGYPIGWILGSGRNPDGSRNLFFFWGMGYYGPGHSA